MFVHSVDKEPDYSFQPGCVERIRHLLWEGVTRLIASAPCGAGKTRMMSMLFEEELAAGGRPIVYTNRKIIRDQLESSMRRWGIDVGVRASGVKPDLKQPAQVSSIPTEASRSLSKYHPWELHKSTLVLIDEAHENKGPVARAIMDSHEANGAKIIGFTATPVDMGFNYEQEDGTVRRLYDHLENLVYNSELRHRNVIVPIDVFAPSEINYRGVSLKADGEYVQTKCRQTFNDVKWAAFGNAYDSLLELNPRIDPFVIVAPGVPESRWIAKEFSKKGLAVEHIDADTPDLNRDAILNDLKNGVIHGVSQYSILGVGWDAPFLKHMINLRGTKSPIVWIQNTSRVGRAQAGKTRATVQDHSGCWVEPGLGSPNADRHWKLEDTIRVIKHRAIGALTPPPDGSDPPEREPAICKKCSRVLKGDRGGNFKCVCGHKFRGRARMIIGLDGKLTRKVGTLVKPPKKKNDTYFFRQAVYAICKSGGTVGQAYGYANRLKKDSTKDKSEYISRDDCSIPIPQKHEPEWKMKASVVYPWAARS